VMPSTLVEFRRRSGRTYCLHLRGRKVCWEAKLFAAYLAFSSTLRMEVVRSSETSVNFYQIRRRHIPENSSLHCHCCEDFKSKSVFCYALLSLYARHVNILVQTSYYVIWNNDVI
jgi:hypothetical protein